MANVTEVKRKICIIGNAGVGKTSLIRKYVLDLFNDRYLSTIGSKVTKKRLNIEKDKDNIIDLNMIIWDIMGQKGFERTQTSSFYGAHGAIIVCDITRKETLSDIAHWRDLIFEIADEIPIIILANKHDLIKIAEFTKDDLDEVTNELQAPCFFTSAKTGENVENAFMEIGKKLID